MNCVYNNIFSDLEHFTFEKTNNTDRIIVNVNLKEAHVHCILKLFLLKGDLKKMQFRAFNSRPTMFVSGVE